MGFSTLKKQSVNHSNGFSTGEQELLPSHACGPSANYQGIARVALTRLPVSTRLAVENLATLHAIHCFFGAETPIQAGKLIFLVFYCS